MQKICGAVLLMLVSLSSFGQTFGVDTLLKNGPLDKRINLVFMGDGYTAGEQGQFIMDVNGIIFTLFNQSPFKEYKKYFNVFAIKVISEESGANHPATSQDMECLFVPQKAVNNYFGSTFDTGNIHRLLYPVNVAKVVEVLASNFPMYDQAFITVNTTYYGGAGGFVATCSRNINGREVAIHEIGHSLAGLADEYWAGPQYAQEKPNMTKQVDDILIKWRNWLGVSDVGIYPHSEDPTWKKPHQECKMGVLNKPLCKVCSERFVERFHELVDPIEDYSPDDNAVIEESEDENKNKDISFNLNLVKPNPSTLKITWQNNDVEFAVQQDKISISIDTLITPAIIRATVLDTTGLSRNDLHEIIHVDIVEWVVKRKGDVDIKPEKKYEVQVFANPIDTELNFTFKLSDATKVSVFLLDLSGKVIRAFIEKQLMSPDKYGYTFTKESLGLPPSSACMLRFSFDNTNITRKIFIK